MSSDVINPFKQTKKIDWAKKNQERLLRAKKKTEDEGVKPLGVAKKAEPVQKQEPVKRAKKVPGDVEAKRVAKSFKIYPGKLSREFDKRVNKLQVRFDDLDYDKNYVDSGKYIMFIMAFAEKYKLFELYKSVGANGELHIGKQDILNHFGKVFQ